MEYIAFLLVLIWCFLNGQILSVNIQCPICEAKFIWFFTNEDILVLKLVGKYMTDCLDIRRGDYCCHK